MTRVEIAVLFDGAGLARLGLERAGHACTGYEVDTVAHHFSGFVGSGNCVLADVRDVDYSRYDAAWCSPPCQLRSAARTQGPPSSPHSEDLLRWSLDLAIRFPNLRALWVENILVQWGGGNEWGNTYNAGQFLSEPIQSRNRVVGGYYPEPTVFRPYQKRFDGVCPAITATEYKGCAGDRRRASRHYGRKLTTHECAYHQGFDVPTGWMEPLPGFTEAAWRRSIYAAIGNGVPVYMAEAFGRTMPE